MLVKDKILKINARYKYDSISKGVYTNSVYKKVNKKLYRIYIQVNP